MKSIFLTDFGTTSIFSLSHSSSSLERLGCCHSSADASENLNQAPKARNVKAWGNAPGRSLVR